MPNWCSTNITFYSENKNQIEKLHSVLDELDANETRLPNGFGNLWLGNIIDYFGENYKGNQCRGEIAYFDEVRKDEEYYCFEIQQMDAWCPQLDAWEIALSRADFCDVNYVYVAEESGCGIYVCSDTDGLFYGDKYVVDLYLEGKYANADYDSSMNYFDDEDECLGYLNDIAKALGEEKDFKTVEEANHWFSMFLTDDVSYCFTNEYKMV